MKKKTKMIIMAVMLMAGTACEQEPTSQPINMPDMKKRIRTFLELDEGMKDKLRVDEEFRRASNEYVEARNEMIFKKLKNGDRVKRAARVVDSLGRTRGVRNGFAYCLWFEEEMANGRNYYWDLYPFQDSVPLLPGTRRNSTP